MTIVASLKLTGAVLLGFLLGNLFHLSPAKAQAGHVVWVQIADNHSDHTVVEGNVVGFSCTTLTGSDGSRTSCYIASQ
jgi:hypothetical protein